MNVTPYWKEDCAHRWTRWSNEINMLGDLATDRPIAVVEIAPVLFDQFPEFKGRWVWTCYARAECGAWIGSFDTPQLAIEACEKHFASKHTKLFWPDCAQDITP
jgi:hypothetical protein